jgi:hypothetical protein
MVDIGLESTAWMHDKVRKAVRNVFSDTFKNIISEMDASSTAGSPTLSNPDDEDVNEGGWSNKVDPAALAASVEDELFDYLSEGEKGRGRTCGDKVGFVIMNAYCFPLQSLLLYLKLLHCDSLFVTPLNFSVTNLLNSMSYIYIYEVINEQNPIVELLRLVAT